MKKLVRDILNYDCNAATPNMRNKLLFSVINNSLTLLEKRGKYSGIPEDVEVAFYDGEISMLTPSRQLLFPKDILLNKDEILADIGIIAHETCHLMQEFLKDKSTIIPTKNRIYYIDTYYMPLFKEFLQLKHPDIYSKITNDDSIHDACYENGALRNMYYYLVSFYYLQPCEDDAYSFENEFLEKLYNSSKKIKDFQGSNINWEIIPEGSNAFLKRIDIMKHVRANEVKGDIKYIASYVGNNIIKKYDDIFEYISSRNDKDFRDEEKDMIRIFARALELNYNDTIAHKLLNALLDSGIGIYAQDSAIGLYTNTPLELTQLEQAKLKKELTKFNKATNNNFTLTKLTKNKKIITDLNTQLSQSPDKKIKN